MTDEQRKRENAVTMARAVCDILDVVELHRRHVERVCARYKDEPAFWEHMRSMGRTVEVEKYSTRSRETPGRYLG